jgi:ribosomal protein S18 acetylase RimI-like enzyme
MLRRRRVVVRDASSRIERLPIAPPPWPSAIQKLRVETFGREFARTFPRQARVGSWVTGAVVGQGVTGYAWCVPSGFDEHACYIEEVLVHRALRQRGLGTDFVLAAASWMEEKGYTEIAIRSLHDDDESRRQAWFRRMGFEDIGYGVYASHPAGIGQPGTAPSNGSDTSLER